MRYEKIEVGDVHEFGRYEMTEDEIVSFAESYDPQPFHTDPEAARESPYGGLIASGWHTCAATMRMVVEHRLGEETLGSPGVKELRWENPVRPGDVLSVRTEVTGKRPLESDPSKGAVQVHLETLDQDGETKLSMDSTFFVVRAAGQADGV